MGIFHKHVWEMTGNHRPSDPCTVIMEFLCKGCGKLKCEYVTDTHVFGKWFDIGEGFCLKGMINYTERKCTRCGKSEYRKNIVG